MKRTTRNDVALRAGVSTATVSHVLNGTHRVSDAIRKRVLKAVEELNYTPDSIARSLITGTSNHIALILDDITNPHFALMARGVQRVAARRNCILSISLAAEDTNAIVTDYLSRRVDGIIFNAYSTKLSAQTWNRVRGSGVQCVFCGGAPGEGYSTVNIDYPDGMKKAYAYLMNLGHERIAYLTGQPRDCDGYLADPRLESFRSCARQFNGGYTEDAIIYGTPPYRTDMESAYMLVPRLLAMKPLPTAVIVANDYMALGVLQRLKESRLVVPRDISVLSFDDTIYARVSSPALTSISSPTMEYGEVAAELALVGRKAPQDAARRNVLLPVSLTIRESTQHHYPREG